MADNKIDPSLLLGEINQNGSIKKNVRICAITGKTIVPGDVRYTITGTNKFYYITASANWQFDDERRAALEAELTGQVPVVEVGNG